jgi:hypothetical protein
MDHVDPNLPRNDFGWYSHRTGKQMPIVQYGTSGHPLLLLPTAQSDLYDCERFLLIRSIQHHIFAGRVTVFSINSVNADAWMNDKVPVPVAARRQAGYSAYVEQEVVPHIRRCVGDAHARIGITGASFGAFHAANLFFRRPDVFDTLVAMSGFYDLVPSYTQGLMSDDIYFNNPMSYIPNISDPGMLDIIKNHTQIHIVSGQGAYEAPNASRRFSSALWAKGIWNNLDLWGHDMRHDWPTWHRMLDFYISEKLGW